jgi:putative transposase
LRYNSPPMTRLRRIATRDRIFFLTTNVERGVHPFSPSERSLILQIIDAEHKKESFWLFGYAVMPDHLHLLLSPAEQDLPRVMRDIKSRTGLALTDSRRFRRNGLTSAEVSYTAPSNARRRGIWQRRYFDHIMRRVHDFWEKLEYIHQNPVAAGLVKEPEDWLWSSYASYTKRGEPPISVDPIDLPVDRNALLWPAPWRVD